MLSRLSILFLGALLLGGCTFLPQFSTAKEAAKQGIMLVKEEHFKLAMVNEGLRCKRPLGLVFRMADAKGEDWLRSYVASCPNIQAYIQRLVGITATRQGFRLVPTPEVAQ